MAFKNEKPRPKEWKIIKNTLPGPGTHQVTEKAFSLTLQSSPVVKFKSDKRIIFAEQTAKQKSYVPSPSAYTFKDFNEKKLWRNIQTKRH